MSAGTVLGLAGLGLVLIYFWTSSRPVGYAPAATPAPTPAVGTPGIDTLVDAAFHPAKYNELIFGIGPDTFVSFAETSDFRAVKDNMCCCYHGNTECCAEVQDQAPGLRCKPGDCDCNPVDLGGGRIQYRDAQGGPYVGQYGSKELARQGYQRRQLTATSASTGLAAGLAGITRGVVSR